MSNYVNFNSLSTAVQSVYYPTLKTVSGPNIYQSDFETNQHDVGINQQKYGSFATSTSTLSSIYDINSSSKSSTLLSQGQNFCPLPNIAGGDARTPIAVASIGAISPTTPAYIESIYLTAGIPNQQFLLAHDGTRFVQNKTTKIEAEGADKLDTFDITDADISESAIRIAQAAYNDAVNKVNEARNRLNKLHAARGNAFGVGFELSNPLDTDASQLSQVRGVRFAMRPETIKAPSTPLNSDYQFQKTSLMRPKKQQPAESVYFGMLNNLQYATGQSQAYNGYPNASHSTQLNSNVASSNSAMTTAIQDASLHTNFASSEVDHSISESSTYNVGCNRAGANSEYHLETLRY